MITNIPNNQNQFAKNEANKENKNEKTDKKTSLIEGLKNPLISKTVPEAKLPKDYVSKIDQKLQELLNKLLDQIKTNKNTDLPILKNQKDLNFAPNFANEIKKLQTELSKTPEFEKIFKNLEEFIKPAKEINNKNLSSLIKNSGVFLEAKLNYSLKEQILPQSFFNLLSTIKGASNENLKHDISNLDLKNLDTTSTLKELIHILQNHKKNNKASLENTNYKALFKLFDKIENFKNYINKNPNTITQEKLQNLANNFIKDLGKNLTLINKELAKPENIKIQNTHILKELSQNIKNLIIFLKDIKNHKNNSESIQNKTNNFIQNQNIKDNEKNGKPILNKYENSQQEHDKQEIQRNQDKNKEIPKDNKTPQNNNSKEDIKNNPTQNNNSKEIQKDEKHPIKSTDEIKKDDNKTQNSQNVSKPEDIFKNQSNKTLLEDIFKQNVSKNLNFMQNFQEELLDNLNKELGNIGRKLNEILKALDPKNYEAKNSLDDIKNIEKKLEISIKDIGKITQKNTGEINSELQQDLKSTLLQISNLAKNLDNENILNQANRLIVQLEFNQLLSLANNSIHTFLPFFWNDLEKSNVVFKRGKKDKFYAQINLEFEKLGKINVFLSLSNDKYVDINMMIENVNFRKKLYERAHELKKALVKVGLLSSNFFISDIVKSKFHNQEEYNDFNMGFDTRA
ncbi:flagellar hook-length control protein FliK [Campylobacter armoricus]|uniref:C-terminal FliK domain-containing protein n=1 Tax=Campylobacter armoricus TaxID=2505970 RepID=A0A7L5I053_9BACT|nr:flagellar hook-length control protein FliK [Campylobacter armoricus]QKF79501.1 C-terminal FliK domain-containing protein [Campylobacter armoricus]